jgi:hypothetical protein
MCIREAAEVGTAGGVADGGRTGGGEVEDEQEREVEVEVARSKISVRKMPARQACFI